MLLYSISVFFHILLVTIWIGGQLFLPLVLIPALKNNSTKKEMLISTGLIFSKVGKISLILLLATGLLNLYFRGIDMDTLLHSRYGQIFLIKLFIFTIMVGFVYWHERYILKRIGNEIPEEEYRKYRKIASISGRITMILSLIMVWLGIMLAKGL